MNTQRWFFLLYLFIAPIIVAVSQALILEFPTVNALTGSPYDPFPQIFYLPSLIGLFLLGMGALTTSILETLRQRRVSHGYGLFIWILSPLVFLFLFWFGINLSQRMVILDYLNALQTSQLSLLGMFYLRGIPEVFPKLGFLPFYVAIAAGLIGLFATLAQCYLLLRDKSR